MEAATASLALTAGSSILGGVSSYNQAKGMQDQANLNASIARTRALQADASSRQSMEQQLGNMRTAFAQGGIKPGVGTLNLLDSYRQTQAQDRTITKANNVAQAGAYDLQAQSYGSAANGALIQGLGKAGPSIFDLYQKLG